MATALDIVTGALRAAGISAIDDVATADDASYGLGLLNDMMQAWTLDGMTLDPVFTDMALTDTFPLADAFREGVKYMLAARLNPAYSQPQSFDSDGFFRKIQAAYTVIPDSAIDTALTDQGRTDSYTISRYYTTWS